jgi:hypothetical protein
LPLLLGHLHDKQQQLQKLLALLMVVAACHAGTRFGSCGAAPLL